MLRTILQIKDLTEKIGFKVLHGIVDNVVWESISRFKEAMERKTSILTEVDSYDCLPMSNGTAYNRYTGIYIPLLEENKKRGSSSSI
jgi:hypothetical protein